MDFSDQTLSYYNTHAKAFVSGTLSVDFSHIQNKFLSKLLPNSLILDFGCGSGRDSKYFMEKGFRVEAVDGSVKLCELASVYTGIVVRNMLFQELEEQEKYDAIWACSSILHLPYDTLKSVMNKMERAIKNGGIIYTSFKYGNFAGDRNGRYFIDMTEESFSKLLAQITGLTIEEMWVSSDVRPKRDSEQWLNLFLRKCVAFHA